MLGTVLVVILILFLLGAFPRQGAYNAEWGYGPSGFLGFLLVVVLILLVLGRL